MTELNEKTNSINLKDHDLLIRLNTKMEGIEVSIKDLRDGLIKRVEILENRANDNDTFHTEIKTMMKVWGIVIAGIMAIIQIVLKFFFK